MSMERIPYQKNPISIDEQVRRLKQRGLIFDDESLAKAYLSNISYYRLRAYTYPFQDNEGLTPSHHFIREDIHFCDIIALYRFDRQLRLLIFNALEKIEVAIRTKLTQLYAEAKQDSHWFCQPDCYYSEDFYEAIQRQIKEDVSRRFMVHITLPYNTVFPFMDRKTARTIKQNKLFALLSCIKYLNDILSPQNDFKENLKGLLSQGGKLLEEKDMGFPTNWENLPVWH